MKHFLNQQFSNTVAVSMTVKDFFIAIGGVMIIFLIAGAVVYFSNHKSKKLLKV